MKAICIQLLLINYFTFISTLLPNAFYIQHARIKKFPAIPMSFILNINFNINGHNWILNDKQINSL